MLPGIPQLGSAAQDGVGAGSTGESRGLRVEVQE